MSTGSGAHSRFLGAVEVIVGIVIDIVTGGTGGNSLILLGASTILETLLIPSPESSGSGGILRSSVANQQIAYGQVLTGGVLQFASSWGSNGSGSGQSSAFLTCAIAHSLTRKNSAGTAGMPIGGILGFYLNNVWIPVNAGGGQGGWNKGRGSYNDGSGTCGISTGTIGGQPAPYNPLSQNLWISFSDGSQTTPDASITNNFATCPANFVGNGIVYSTWTMFASGDQPTYSAAFPAGIETPNTIKALFNGQLIYDPRLDSTNGGTGPQRLSDSTTWTFTSNPALCLADYLTRPKSDGGAGYATSQLDWTAVATAATVCDTEITVPAYGATWNGTAWSATNQIARYSFNAIIDTGQPVDTNVQLFLKSMAGWLTTSGGIIQIQAGAETDPSGTIDETFLAGSVSLTCQIQRQQMWNAVKFTYGAEPNSDYNAGQAMALTNATYEAQDGNVRLWNSDTIRGCNNQFACQILERIKLQQSRNKMTLQMKCNLKALQFQSGDVVNVNIAELSLTNAPFRIIQLAMSSDYSITLSLLQENAGTFLLPTTPDAVYQPFNVPSYQTLYNQLPAPPGTPASVTATATSSGILLNWQPPAASTFAYQEVFRSTSPGSGFVDIANVTGDSFLDANTTAGTTYYYYIVAVQPANQGNQSGSPSGTVSATSITSEPSTSIQSNYIPDSELRYGLIYIPNASGSVWSASAAPGDGVNALEAVGTGSAWATSYRYSVPFYLSAGTYTLSANCSGSANITAGSVFAGIYAFTKGTGLGSQQGSVSFGVGANADGRPSTTFTIASGGYFVYLVDTNAATASNGNKVYIFKPQLEAGSVMTAYRGQFDASGYSILNGSGPQNVADLYFNWTSTTTTIALTPTNNEWYQADGSLAAFNNGTFFPGPNTESGFSASTSGKVYPYVDLQNSLLNYTASGLGSPDFIVQTTAAEQLAAVAQQNNANRTPLSGGGIPVSTPASGTGGGSAGGNKCLHAAQAIPTQSGDKAAADLCIGDLVLTPTGYQPVLKMYREPCSVWVIVTTDTGDTLTVTPAHCLYDAHGGIVRADALHLGQLLQGGAGGVRAVRKLEWHEEPSMLVRIEVADPNHQFIAAGLVHRNGTVKP